MNATPASAATIPHRPGPRHGLPWKLLLATLLLLLLGFGVAAEYILRNAEPILRRRITETLAARFHAPVTLDALSLSLLRGIEVSGTGLRIGYPAGTAPATPGAPMITVAHFRFRTGLLGLLRESLLHQPTHVAFARVEGLTVHIPPRASRPADQPTDDANQPEKVALLVDQFQCRDIRLFLVAGQASANSQATPKPPREVDISTLDLQHVDRHGSLLYDAQLTNPKPTGQLHVTGHFGPWANDKVQGQPGQTPIDGNYTLDHANLATIRGLAGTLTSTGHFAGTLDRLLVDGHTDTPDFSLSIANHPVPLHTDFHAIVDATTGDTYLQPVHASLAGSAFTTTGKIVRVATGGHDIQLDVQIPHGHIQDFLRLAVKTSPPLMNGTLAMRAQLHIPPGNAPVPEKLSLTGTFNLTAVQFSNPRWQTRIDTLSTHAQLSPSPTPIEARSQLSANLTLEHGVLGITDLRYSVPGVLALMNGVYSTDGKLFEFKGHVRTDATASQMVGGWRGLLLSPFDHYLQKNGAGIELPVEISGTGGDLHFGLATDSPTEKPTQLLADIKAKTVAKQELAGGRDLLAQARAEDTAASQASTLEEAGRHHNNAVHLRAEAAHLAQQSLQPR